MYTCARTLIGISRIPGGARVSLEEDLRRIAKTVKADSLSIKISGDGAHVANNYNFVCIAYTLLQGEDTDLSVSGQHTIAIGKGGEDYMSLKLMFSDVFEEIDMLKTKGSIEVCGNQIPLSITIGGDMKFLLNIFGLKGATSTNSCLYCLINKDERWNTTYPKDFYTKPPMKRNYKLEEPGTKHAPLMPSFGSDCVVICELHLLLRITDIFLRNLIYDSQSLDGECTVKSGKKSTQYIDELVRCICRTGVDFRIWETEGKLEFTTLNGTQKKQLLAKLPDILRRSDSLHSDTSRDVLLMWTQFHALYQELTSWTPDADSVFTNSKSFLDLFLHIGAKRSGYLKENVTPYMHILLYHVPSIIELHSNLRMFSGQGLEKSNDEVRRILQKKTSKWDTTVDVIKTRKRIELSEMAGMARKKRAYNKRNTQYWDKELQDKRSEKHDQITTSNLKVNEAHDKERLKQLESLLAISETLAPVELKQKMEALSVQTRTVKTKKRLMAILREACI